jgi:hypothetical protein
MVAVCDSWSAGGMGGYKYQTPSRPANENSSDRPNHRPCFRGNQPLASSTTASSCPAYEHGRILTATALVLGTVLVT